MLLNILTQVRLVFSLFSLCILTLIPSVSLFAAQFTVGTAAATHKTMQKMGSSARKSPPLVNLL
jgi:hypothetical protein